MMGIQEWVHALEVGEGRRYVKLAGSLLGLLFLLAVYDTREFRNFSTSEAMDVSQLARNISEGKGFVTDCIRPFSMFLVQRERSDRDMKLRQGHPDLMNPPIYPLLLAGWMKFMPMHYYLQRGGGFMKYQPEVLIAFLNQTLLLGVLVMTFLLGRAMFDPMVGLISTIVVALTEVMWRFSASGLSTMLLILIFLGLVGCFLMTERLAENEGTGAGRLAGLAIGIGLLLGIGMLTRYSFGVLAVPSILYVACSFPKRRLVMALVVSCVFLMVVTPWLVRNFRLSGNLFGAAGYAFMEETQRFPDSRLQRSLNPDFSKFGPGDVLRKFMLNASEIIQNDLPKLGQNWISAFFLVGMMIPFQGAALARLRRFGLGSVAALFLAQALFRTYLTAESPIVNSENLLVLMFPLVAIFGVAMYETLLEQIPLPFPEARHLVTGGLVFIVSLPLLLTLLPPRIYPVAYPPYHPPVIQQTASWLAEDDLMMSDVPWAVAWYGKRPCVWTTLTVVPDFYTINDLTKPVKGLYLTQLTTDTKLSSEVLMGADFAWQRFALDAVLRTNLPAGFPLKHGRRDFQQSGQIFLTDRNRWGGRLVK